jgi:hypothetical protein
MGEDGCRADDVPLFRRTRHGFGTAQPAAHHASCNNHIIRSQWNYQFTRELSLRAILQYNGLLANPTYSSLRTTKDLSTDFLITYLVHPGNAWAATTTWRT